MYHGRAANPGTTFFLNESWKQSRVPKCELRRERIPDDLLRFEWTARRLAAAECLGLRCACPILRTATRILTQRREPTSASFNPILTSVSLHAAPTSLPQDTPKPLQPAHLSIAHSSILRLFAPSFYRPSSLAPCTVPTGRLLVSPHITPPLPRPRPTASRASFPYVQTLQPRLFHSIAAVFPPCAALVTRFVQRPLVR